MVTPARQAGEIRAAFWCCADAVCISGSADICIPWCGTHRKNNGGKNMKKKLLALMMVFVMLLSASPMAFAAQTADQLLDEAKTELMSSKVKDVLQTAVKFID